MKKRLFVTLVAALGLLYLTGCKCNSNGQEQITQPEPVVEEEVELSSEINVIGVWETKIARDDSYMTFYYMKNEKQFYVHDELKNAQGTYYDKVSPVAVSLQPAGRYLISYQNGIKDCYYIGPETGVIDWRCEGYNPEIVKPKSFNAKLFKLALEDNQ